MLKPALRQTYAPKRLTRVPARAAQRAACLILSIQVIIVIGFSNQMA